MKPLFPDHTIIHVLMGLVALWLSYKGIRAGYQTLLRRKFPKELKEMDPLLRLIGIPEDYYQGKMLIWVGIANIIGGAGIGCASLAMLFNTEFLGWIGIVIGGLLGLACLFVFFFNPPWKIKKGN